VPNSGPNSAARLEGFRSSCEAPRPPTSFSPCGSKNCWQVLRELRETLCQRFPPVQGPQGEITTFCPVLGHLSTIFLSKPPHTNYLVARFPQLSRLVPDPTVSFGNFGPRRSRPGGYSAMNYE